MRDLPGTEKALGAAWGWAHRRTVCESVRWRRRGRPLRAAPGTAWRRGAVPPPRGRCSPSLLRWPALRKVFLPRRNQKLRAVFLAPSLLPWPRRQGARLNVPGGFRRLQVDLDTRRWGTPGKNQTKGFCALSSSVSRLAGRGDGVTVAIGFVVVLSGRDGRRLFPCEGIATLRLMETCILLDPEGKVGVRPQPRSWK